MITYVRRTISYVSAFLLVCILFAGVGASGSGSTAYAFTATGKFYVSGTTIVDPAGQEFIPLGTNVTGWNYGDWAHDALNHVDVIEQAWKFNVVRANINLDEQWWNGNQISSKTWYNSQAEAKQTITDLVNAYTSRGIVVMLEVHDFTCSYPTTSYDHAKLNDFWSWAADTFKNNTYVWFNLLNEPGYDPGGASYSWVTSQQPLIQLIRDTKSADNVIIVDGTQCGQEAGTWDNNAIPEANSAILSYGDQLKYFNNKTYADIAFNFHMYDQWSYNNTAMDNKLSNYIDRVHAKGHSIFIGEVGARGTTDTHHAQVTDMAYRIALPKGVGMLAWHFDPKDGFKLTDGNGAYRGSDLNSWTNPTNLSSWQGYYFWQATNADGYGLGSGGGSGGQQLISNGSFTSTTAPWVLNTYGANAALYGGYGTGVINISDGGDASWRVTLSQELGGTMNGGTAYSIELDLAGSGNRSIDIALVDKNTGYTHWAAWSVPVYTSTQNLQYTFTPSANLGNLKLEFRAGGNNEDIYLGNVSISD